MDLLRVGCSLSATAACSGAATLLLLGGETFRSSDLAG